jgi:3-hydroxyacyl-CoA dehydrogenase
MWYADTVGLKHVYERILAFHNQHGHHWQPAPLLARLAAEGRTFSSLDAEKEHEAHA